MSEAKRDCVFLVADRTMAEVFRGFLGRDEFHRSLGSGAFEFDPSQDLVVESSDPAVFHRAHYLLEPYQSSHQHAVVVLDTAWAGSPGAAAITTGIEEQLRPRWEHFVVVAIDPELEAWIWQDSPHVATALRYRTPQPLRDWLKNTGDWPANVSKPPDPKAAVEKVLRYTRTPRSAAVYRRIVSRISVRSCEDPAFHKLAATLRGWFGTESS